ncbi:mitochondrial-processing peptidase subunit alpha [[Candida] anglica]|uniref:Mitochondrial-processing peptidase subunit alpha n=1 Tax=[Candida] anglica TaxID=148631 RepID=A0ABP0EII0_9ASCO
MLRTAYANVFKQSALSPVRRYASSSTVQTFSKPNIEMTTLANGLRVVTDSTPGHFSALGMYVDAGSRYENPRKPGLSHIFDRLAWKSTENYTGIEMMENLAKVGGNYIASAQRESMLYQASVFNKDVDKMFDYMAQTVRVPKITDQEMYETLQTVDFEVSNMYDKTDVYLPEILHAAAYKGNTLGLPLFCPQERLPSITRKEILQYHRHFYQPQNVIVALVGVQHEQAVRLAMSHLGDWSANTLSKPDMGKITYTGGEICLPYQPPVTPNLPELYHMQIGFETTGLLNDDLYALATLQKLLGGGSSFSAGGPGKGMFSRLFTRVLNKYSFVENCMAFNHSYVDSGVFGVTISCMPNYGNVMAQIICQELSDLLIVSPEKGGITQDELQRAKNQLSSSLLMNLESKLSSLEDLGRQIQAQNKLTTVEEMIAKIDALTIEDVRSVAARVLSGKVATKGNSSGLATVVMQGDRQAIGDVQQVLSYFDLGRK